MLYIISLILLTLSGVFTAMTLVQVRTKQLRRPILYFFNIFFLLLFILVPLIVEALGGAQTIRWNLNYLINQANVLSIYAMYTLVFSATSLILVSSARTRRFIPTERDHAPYLTTIHAQYSFFLLLVVAFGMMVYIAGSGMSLKQLLVASRFGWLDNSDSNGLLVLLSLYFLSVIAPAAFHVFKSDRTKILEVAALLLFVAIAVAISGGRKWVLFLISGYIAAKYFHARSLKISPFDSVILSGLVVFVAVWQFGRHLNEVSLDSIIDIFIQRGLELILRGDISYFYRASLEAISININEGTWYPFSALRTLLLLPFPNEVTFGLKPEGLPTSFARDIGAINSLRVGNMPPSMIGVFVLSFGAVPGIPLFGMLLPALLTKADNFFMKRSVVRDSLLGYAIVVIVTFARGNIDVLYYPLFYYLVFKMMSLVLLLLRGPRQRLHAWRDNAET